MRINVLNVIARQHLLKYRTNLSQVRKVRAQAIQTQVLQRNPRRQHRRKASGMLQRVVLNEVIAVRLAR